MSSILNLCSISFSQVADNSVVQNSKEGVHFALNFVVQLGHATSFQYQFCFPNIVEFMKGLAFPC